MAVHIPSRQKVSLAAMAGVARAAAPTAGAIRTPLTPALRCQLRTTNALAPIASTIGMSRSASTAASAPASSNVPDDVLTWDRFFNLRQRRRWVNLASSLGTSVTTIAIAGPILAQQDIDTWAAQLSGIDPIFVLGIATLSVGAGGWLLGPTIGTQIFKMMIGKKGWQKEIAAKEKSFYDRIKRYRADPSSSSPQNPIPDYYGEKISSVKDYRRWLKDQRAFNLKKNKNML